MITVRGVSKVFNTQGSQVEALRGIDLHADEGEFVTLVGRSGCGKSTLLRIIAGLIPSTTGKVTVGGLTVERPRQDVAVMFQKPALLPWRTVLENILLPIEIIRGGRDKYMDRARALIATTGLEGFEDALPRQLSGGMQQRVSLCRSLVYDPQVLLMDEPFAALDALTREEMAMELQRISLEQQKTVVFVTHSIDEAVLLADRVVVLTPRPGRIREVIPVNVPRPRTLGHTEHTEALADRAAHLHDLLFEPAAESA